MSQPNTNDGNVTDEELFDLLEGQAPTMNTDSLPWECASCYDPLIDGETVVFVFTLYRHHAFGLRWSPHRGYCTDCMDPDEDDHVDREAVDYGHARISARCRLGPRHGTGNVTPIKSCQPVELVRYD